MDPDGESICSVKLLGTAACEKHVIKVTIDYFNTFYYFPILPETETVPMC